MNTARQTLLIARNEWADALRSRRALAVLILYVAVAALTMNGLLSILVRLEKDLSGLLGLSSAPEPGAVVDALWNSARFRGMVAGAMGSEEIARELIGVSPVALAFAGLAFFYTPLLVALLAPARIAEERASGSIRYIAVRAPRLAWTVGKLLGQTALVGAGLGLSALAAWAVAVWRLPAANTAVAGAGIFAWTLRVWVYAFAFLGLTMGVGHLTRSPGKALALAVLALIAVVVLAALGRHYEAAWFRGFAPIVRALTPIEWRSGLWRRSPAHLLPAIAALVSLGWCYLLAGYAAFRRRDL